MPGSRTDAGFCLRLQSLGYRHMVSPYAPVHLDTTGRKMMMCDQFRVHVSENAWKAFAKNMGSGSRIPTTEFAFLPPIEYNI